MNPLITQLTKAVNARKVQVPLSLVLVLCLLFSAAGIGGLLGYRSYKNQVAKAIAQEQAYKAEIKTTEAQEKLDALDRDKALKQQKTIEVRYVTREVAAKKKADEISHINPADTAKVVDVAQSTLGVAPKPEPDGLLGFDAPSVLKFAETKVERDEATAAKGDLRAMLALEQSKTTSLSADLAKEMRARQDAESLSKTWKKVAVESRWRKTGRYALTGVAIAGAFYVGTKVHSLAASAPAYTIVKSAHQ